MFRENSQILSEMIQFLHDLSEHEVFLSYPNIERLIPLCRKDLVSCVLLTYYPCSTMLRISGLLSCLTHIASLLLRRIAED